MYRDDIDERIITHAHYYVDNSSTVREVAKHFGLSKSQVHIDITEKLKKLDLSLYDEVRKVIEKNKKERHFRGGLAFKTKCQLLKGAE